MTFKVMENMYPAIRDGLISRQFTDWQGNRSFLLRHMQMIRVRTPQFFQEHERAVATSFVGRVASVDEVGMKLHFDSSRPLSKAK